MLSATYSKRMREDGFTLIELLIVVIVIGILAAIALPIFITQQKAAVDASVKSDVRNSVTNITNAQAQDAPSVKLAKSRAETSIKVFEGTSTDANVEDSDGKVHTPKLGSAYKVEGKNAKGDQYASKVFQFNSSTGQFGQADATVPLGVVVSSTTFGDGTTNGFNAGNTPSVNAVEAVDGHPFAFHARRQSWAGGQQSITGPVDYSKPMLRGKTYKATADIYVAPGTTLSNARIYWDLFNVYSTDVSNLHSGWNTVTFTTPSIPYNDYIYTYMYIFDSTSTNNNGYALDVALDNIVYKQMD